MSVFKRGEKWCIGYSLNGRWVRKSIGTSKKIAELAEKEIKLNIAKGEFLGITEPKKILLEELCCEYLQYSKANKTAQSYRRDQVSMKNLLASFNGKLITKITAHDLENYKNKRRDQVTAATVNRELSCIKHMYNKAVQWEYLKENRLRSVMKFREPPRRMRYLAKEEITRLLDCCAEHVRPIVVMALNTGMRKGEILKLKWQDIDLKNRIIIVRNSKNHESRTLPINEMLYGELRFLGQRLPVRYVFSHPNGKPYYDIKDGFSAALKRAGIADFRFHDLRHTYGVYLAMNGTPLLVIQRLMGHKTISVTVDYCKFSNELMMKEAVDKLDFSGYTVSTDHTNTAHLKCAKS